MQFCIRHPNTVSLTRALSKLGYCSRSQAITLIEQRKVLVNGKIVNDATVWVDLKKDKITVDGKSIAKKKFVYILMNKPRGVVTTRSDERNRKTVYDLLVGVNEWVFPIGRLDKDTTGLLLLTNDNQLGERLTSPASKVPKTYLVQIDRPMREEDKAIIRNGVVLKNEELLPAKINSVNVQNGEYWIEMTIVEGKNRQIRRMCETLGYSVISLRRTKIGNLTVQNLNEGEWKYLAESEIKIISMDF
ncbi:MAG: rRNA pseudouridine synthase [Bacteroidetes bacterium]|nr:MAG: rRNA pseudouridine synthase [Bacteroidota bacterium]